MITVAAGLATAALARAEQTEFVGIHPHTHRARDGFCYLEVPHVHANAPSARARVLYRVRDDRYYFVADPVAFAYDGPRVAYYGPHPVYHDGYDTPAFCYLDGPHFHATAPVGDKFVLEGNAYWFVGELPPDYVEAKPVLSRVNAVYRPLEYERPQVVVEAPPAGYVGPFVAVGVGVSAPVAVVGAEAEVVLPAPPAVRAGFSIEAIVPGVVIEPHIHNDESVVVYGHGKHQKLKPKKYQVYDDHSHVEVRDHRKPARRLLRRH
jgi:hypothetical protein